MKENGKGFVTAAPHVQFTYNTTYHTAIKNTPYKAVYGSASCVCLHSYGLPEEILSSVHDEDDLDRALAASGIERLEPDVATPVFLETEAFSDPEESVQEQNDPEMLPHHLSLEVCAAALAPSSPVGTDLDSTNVPR